ncbi:hypothetical protein [Candidatus Hecatella orcuttiae]|uniref:hypothetical protein n=1 Tax=Candidatus Hecatella orcuttiae TaxID=1935119 RepID=UPI002867BA19|nr:hypothetical protein [Candidatus Hecatella orcuttiae]
MLTFLLAEAALEVIPPEIRRHRQVVALSRRLGKKAEVQLLDKSYHYRAMGSLKDKEKRGRPDIVHLTLLEALGSPLNLAGLLRTYVHTYDDRVIFVNPQLRLPRNYNRFLGLMEQLFQAGRVPPEEDTLLKLENLSFPELVAHVKPTLLVALTRKGNPKTPLEVAEELSASPRPAVVVGGFPHGCFSKAVLETADWSACIDPQSLEAWVAASRIISAYETAIGLPEKRLETLRKSKTHK